jgi:hypothetical protein
MTGEPPKAEYRRAACPRCGARTERQAETICRPDRDITDEYTCPAGEKTDAQGFFIQETPASINLWVDWQLAQDAKAEIAA